MICKFCAREADWRTGPSWPGPHSSTGKPVEGHNACKGCTCQHKPVKEGQISES